MILEILLLIAIFLCLIDILFVFYTQYLAKNINGNNKYFKRLIEKLDNRIKVLEDKR